MALFEDILGKESGIARQTKQSDAITDEQLIDEEFARLMCDYNYLNRRFLWFGLTGVQQQFYVDNVIKQEARQNVMKPILKARAEAQRIKAEADKITFITKYDTRPLHLYLNGEAAKFGASLEVTCPHCGEPVANPSYYIGEHIWRKHLEALAGSGGLGIGTILYRNGATNECEHCKKSFSIILVNAP